MRRFLYESLLVLCTLFPASLLASDRGEQYPLRVHIYQRSEHSHYQRGMLDWVDGDGRANLFEKGEAHGFEFAFRCGDRIQMPAAYETYPAKWKKTGQNLELLLPVMGKPGSTHTCDLKVDMKQFAYFRRHGDTVYSEPVATFKQWMDKHQYDPEQGKDQPVGLATEPAAPEASEPQQ